VLELNGESASADIPIRIIPNSKDATLGVFYSSKKQGYGRKENFVGSGKSKCCRN
jgi:hypothetical protein